MLSGIETITVGGSKEQWIPTSEYYNNWKEENKCK